MLKTKLSGLICYELSSQIEKVFEVKTTVIEFGTHTTLRPSKVLTVEGDFEIKKFIEAFEYGVNALKSTLDEIQERAEQITAKINQI